MKLQPKQHRNAFTLIELLVVIAIISLLVSILLPSLTKAKELAKITICATQLRSLGTALNTYATEHEGEYIHTRRGSSQCPEVVHKDDFCNVLENEYSCSPKMFYCPFKPQGTYPVNPEGEFQDWRWDPGPYNEIGYTYLGAYYENNPGGKYYYPYFKNGYQSPINLDSAESGWALMADINRTFHEGVVNHWFGGDYTTNVMFVDSHVEYFPDKEVMEINFDAEGGYWVVW
ncbi:MAG: prepilin-type N-terminal cleavage/methylation domain-containing protein [Phycisphaerae bacterium]|nr:prepilin-type N-terminal cleavage/methylation domain-containing protein [Phycisphaerae bacterium]